ncbi:MAG TPA: hypothetical protein VKU19_09195 [Bryobacteraceae bacterium]|nr:hypothetical protein [Bryobacteraceae bacterium]
MSHAAELYRFHTAYVLAFLAFVVVYAVVQCARGGRGAGEGE